MIRETEGRMNKKDANNEGCNGGQMNGQTKDGWKD